MRILIEVGNGILEVHEVIHAANVKVRNESNNTNENVLIMGTIGESKEIRAHVGLAEGNELITKLAQNGFIDLSKQNTEVLENIKYIYIDEIDENEIHRLKKM